jgi:hypothetical protein
MFLNMLASLVKIVRSPAIACAADFPNCYAHLSTLTVFIRRHLF